MENIALKLFCRDNNLVLEQATGAIPIDGDLYLSRLRIIPDGFNPIVGGSLHLDSVTELPKGFSPIVGGSLYLPALEELPSNFAPIVGGNLSLRGLKWIYNDFELVVGNCLDLRGLASLDLYYEECFAPTVGGDLNLNGLKDIPYMGFRPYVDGNLYLESITNTSLDSERVNGQIFLADCKVCKSRWFNFPLLSWRNGRYCLFDGILCEVLSHKRDIYKVKIVGKREASYVLTDGSNFSHGETIQQAMAGLLYKNADRDIKQYGVWTLNTRISLKEAIASYRTITGACEQGVQLFVESLPEIPQALTVCKVIELTAGRFGSKEYKAFFAM
ncbi:MAG: hypothetical protein LBV04_03540 [Deferribacteraceae bacterium]|nr:hypothetical protein [Deferribacteraceae bacterium]